MANVREKLIADYKLQEFIPDPEFWKKASQGELDQIFGIVAVALGAVAVPTIATTPYIASYFFTPINTRIMLQQIAPEVPHLQ